MERALFEHASNRRLGTEVRKRETQELRNCKHTLQAAGVKPKQIGLLDISTL